jgi:hypothetical protein
MGGLCKTQAAVNLKHSLRMDISNASFFRTCMGERIQWCCLPLPSPLCLFTSNTDTRTFRDFWLSSSFHHIRRKEIESLLLLLCKYLCTYFLFSYYILNNNLSWPWWWTSVVSATHEAEEGLTLESRSSRLTWATQWDPVSKKKMINFSFQVRCLKDYGEFEVDDGTSVLLKKNSQVFLIVRCFALNLVRVLNVEMLESVAK